VSSFYPGLELATTGVHRPTRLPVRADPGGSAGAIVI
jgi:hypothetical protein